MNAPRRCEDVSLIPTPDTILGTIDGQPITAKSLDEESILALQEEWSKYCTQVDSIYQIAFQNALRTHILKKESELNSLTVEKLIERWSQETSLPTEDDIQKFYDKLPPELPTQDGSIQPKPSLPILKADIQKHLSMEFQRNFLDKKIQLLSSRSTIKSTYPDFRPPAQTMSISASAPRKGLSTAPITIVEFADFECPYCSVAADVLKQVAQAFPNEISITYQHLPLRSIHPHAEEAAVYSYCALQQNKFWEFHDAIYEQQSKGLSRRLFESISQLIKLNSLDLNQCLQDASTKQYIKENENLASRLHVQGTPSIWINGRNYQGPLDIHSLDLAIKRELDILGVVPKKD